MGHYDADYEYEEKQRKNLERKSNKTALDFLLKSKQTLYKCPQRIKDCYETIEDYLENRT